MANHEHGASCGCGEEHEEPIFIVTDEDGNEMEMVMVYTFETNDRAYAVLLDRNDPEADGVLFRIEMEDDEAYLVGIEDEEEWNHAVRVYEQISEQSKA